MLKDDPPSWSQLDVDPQYWPGELSNFSGSVAVGLTSWVKCSESVLQKIYQEACLALSVQYISQLVSPASSPT